MVLVRLGDCLDPTTGLASLVAGSIDVTLTDPPFDQRTHRAGAERVNNRGRLRTGALPFPPLTPDRIGELAAELVRVTKRWIVIFAAERQLETWAGAIEAAGGRFMRFGVAVKTNPAPRFLGDAPGVGVDHLVIGYAGPGRTTWSGRGRPAVWQATPARDARSEHRHPTPKSLDLMRQLVADFTAPGELVLDPFAGSGTTLVAAKQLARRGIGWEIDPDYHAAGLARIEAAREQLQLNLKLASEDPRDRKGNLWRRYTARLVAVSRRKGQPEPLSFAAYCAVLEGAKCFLCEGPIPEHGRGLKLIDKAAGYVEGNVLPWCASCGARDPIARRYLRIVALAKRRDRTVELSLEEYRSIVASGACHYCRGPLAASGHGLDRIDNRRGYLADNVVPCCSRCNSAKGTMTAERFAARARVRAYREHAAENRSAT